MKIIRPLFIIIIVLLSFKPVCSEEPAKGRQFYYTIQTATYSLAAQSYARRHYEFIKKRFYEESAVPVMLLKGKRYLVIRMGRFESLQRAKEVLKQVRTLVSDAFVLTVKDEQNMETVASTPKVEKETNSKEEKKVKPTKNGSAKKVVSKVKENKVMGVIYTIEVGSFDRLRDALKQFRSMVHMIKKDDVDTLRVERHGNSYSLRIGIFKTYKEAEEFLKSYQGKLNGVVIQSQYNPESVAFSYVETKDENMLEEAEEKRQEAEIEVFISEVEDKLDNEDFGEAARLLREAVKRWPENPEIHALYGETLLNMGFAKSAYRQYKKAIELSPDVSQYHSGLGYSLLNIYIQRAQESIEAFQKALEIDPDNVDALEGLGTVYVSIDRKDLAEEIYKRLLELDPVSAKRLRDLIDSGLDITGGEGQ